MECQPLHQPGPGRTTVLLVDDEHAVRRFISHVLELSGFHVLQASQGEEALSASEAFSGRIHLLIADIMMPVMNGKELADRISVLRPGIKILFMSGYAGHILEQVSQEISGSFLPKPFTMDALLEKVAELMAKP